MNKKTFLQAIALILLAGAVLYVVLNAKSIFHRSRHQKSIEQKWHEEQEILKEARGTSRRLSDVLAEAEDASEKAADKLRWDEWLAEVNRKYRAR